MVCDMNSDFLSGNQFQNESIDLFIFQTYL